MKFAFAVALLSLAEVQAAAFPGLDGSAAAPRMIKPKYRSTAKRAIIRTPFTLKAKGTAKGSVSMDPNGQSGTLRIGAAQGMCDKCTLLSAHFRLAHADGKEATPEQGIYIHHLTSILSPKNITNPIVGASVPTATGGLGSAYFIDRGEDSGQTDTIFTTADGKFNSGFHINARSTITATYDFVNYKNTAHQLYLELEYEYVDGIVGRDAGHTLKTVPGLTPKISQVGPATSEASMRVDRDTTVLWARGHLHSGGDRMILLVNGNETCVSRPTYDTDGIIRAMSLCRTPINIKRGSTVKIRSVYDLKKHKLRKASDGSGRAAHGRFGGSDVMGMFAISYTM
jgi:hypothetical protein